MQFATEAIVFDQGIRTRTHILDILGGAQTSIWGLWSKEPADDQIEQQLLLSQVRPSRAHACFRLTLRLHNQPGALAAATAVLAALRVNILSSSSSISGHHHSTWVLLCNVADADPSRVGSANTKQSEPGAWLSATYLAALVVEDVLRYVDYQYRKSEALDMIVPERIENYVKDYKGDVKPSPWRRPLADEDACLYCNRAGFLDLRWDLPPGEDERSEGKLILNDEESKAFSEVTQSRDCKVLGVTPYAGMAETANRWRFGVRRHAVDIAPTPHLITLANEALNREAQIFELKVDDRESVLRVVPQNHEVFLDGYNKLRRGRNAGSIPALFSFDAREAFGSVSVLTASQLIKVRFRYSAAPSPVGVLAATLGPVIQAGMNLTSLRSYLSGPPVGEKPTADPESGVVEFVGHRSNVAAGDRIEPGTLKLKLELQMKELQDSESGRSVGLRLDPPVVREDRCLSIFISTRFDESWVNGHGINIFDAIAERVSALGFTPVFCIPEDDPPRAHLRDHLHARVSECDSLLQILPLLDSEPTVQDVRSRMRWLVKEFHMALVREKPIVQLFQVVPNRGHMSDWTDIFDAVVSGGRSPIAFADVRDLLEHKLERAVKTMNRLITV